MDDIKGRIFEILRGFVPENIVIDDSTKMEELNIDSFQFIQFIIEVEAKFKIEITDDKLDMSEYRTCFELIESINSLVVETSV